MNSYGITDKWKTPVGVCYWNNFHNTYVKLRCVSSIEGAMDFYARDDSACAGPVSNTAPIAGENFQWSCNDNVCFDGLVILGEARNVNGSIVQCPVLNQDLANDFLLQAYDEYPFVSGMCQPSGGLSIYNQSTNEVHLHYGADNTTCPSSVNEASYSRVWSEEQMCDEISGDFVRIFDVSGNDSRIFTADPTISPSSSPSFSPTHVCYLLRRIALLTASVNVDICK